jgi:hypothetical protein
MSKNEGIRELLENMFRHLFATVTRMNEFQVSAIFDRMANNNRLDALGDLLNKTTLTEQIKERVRYFCSGFKICAENRHAIMHSHSGGIYTNYSRNERGILLSKYTRSGNKLVCAASLRQLRAVADDIHTFAMFGGNVISDIRIFLICRENGDEAISTYEVAR